MTAPLPNTGSSEKSTDLKLLDAAINTAIGDAELPIPGLVSIIASYAIAPASIVTTLDPWTRESDSVRHIRGMCLVDDNQRIAFADDPRNSFMQISLRDGRLAAFCGRGTTGRLVGAPGMVSFDTPIAICCDPVRERAYYLSDLGTIRHYDMETKKVSLIAGSRRTPEQEWLAAAGMDDIKSNTCDGVGAAAKFGLARSLLATSCGTTLFVLDSDLKRLRRIELASKIVTCACELPSNTRVMCWDRANVAPASAPAATDKQIAVYMTLGVSRKYPESQIVRYDLSTNEWKQFPLPPVNSVEGIACTRSGIVLFTGPHSIWSFDPSTTEYQKIAGSRDPDLGCNLCDGDALSVATIGTPHTLVLEDDSLSLYIADSNSAASGGFGCDSIRRLNLPPIFKPRQNCHCPQCASPNPK